MSDNIKIFNRQRKKMQQNRAAKKFYNSDFLFSEMSERIASQFGSIITKKFDKVLVLGTKNSYLANLLKQNKNIGEVYETDLSYRFLLSLRGADVKKQSTLLTSETPSPMDCFAQGLAMKEADDLKINCDEEFLPFRNESFDLVLSNLSLHWVNDLVGSLVQIKNILKKDGMFLGAMFGSKTLMELRYCLTQAEGNKGLSPRVSPFIDVKEGAGLMQRVGFKEPLAITEELDVKYESLYQLLFDLRNQGETNALQKLNNKFVGKFFFNQVEEVYFENFSDEQNQLNAKFEIISISGWKK
ncbi:MAG TPA: hypothetical protein DIV86_00035 [Alphaproteobacteria bacterium]|nr:hypothetical protein [Alphaproteobacteria bacterium]